MSFPLYITSFPLWPVKRETLFYVPLVKVLILQNPGRHCRCSHCSPKHSPSQYTWLVGLLLQAPKILCLTSFSWPEQEVDSKCQGLRAPRSQWQMGARGKYSRLATWGVVRGLWDVFYSGPQRRSCGAWLHKASFYPLPCLSHLTFSFCLGTFWGSPAN